MIETNVLREAPAWLHGYVAVYGCVTRGEGCVGKSESIALLVQYSRRDLRGVDLKDLRERELLHEESHVCLALALHHCVELLAAGDET